PRVEILNFATGAFTPLQQDALLDGDRVRRFSPDVVLFVGHMSDLDALNHLAAVGDSIAIPYDSMRAIVSRAGIRSGFTFRQRQRALQPYRQPIVSWSYQHIADATRQMGAIPAWVYVPVMLESHDDIPELARL